MATKETIRRRAYHRAGSIRFNEVYYRGDIGAWAADAQDDNRADTRADTMEAAWNQGSTTPTG